MDMAKRDELPSNPLSSPFAGSPAASPSRIPVHADSLISNPDAFYRLSSNNTVLPDIFIDIDDQTMPLKQKQPHLNGSASKPDLPSTLPRTTYRSASGPVESSTARSKPGVTTRPGLIKERVKQFDASNSARTSSPIQTAAPMRNGATSRLKKPSQARPPLFGEVVDADGAGYGIPTLHSQKSSIDSTSSKANGSARPRTPLHDRSSSNGTDVDPSLLAPSRIPVPRTRRASDIGPSVPSLKSPAGSDRNLASSRSFGQSPRSKQSSPSAHRYSPKRNVEASQTLTAVIKSPPPKLSPPLRSSRPRKPVSDASTAASRAKVSDRFTKSIAEKQVSRSTPKDIIPVDVASRRDQVHSNLSRTYLDRPKSKDGKPRAKLSKRPDAAKADAQHLSPLVEQAPVAAPEEYDYEEELSVVPRCPSTPPRQNSLLSQIMGIRENSPRSPDTRLPDDFLSEVGDGETIQVVLGATPKLPSENFFPPQAPPIPQSDEDFAFSDNRTSIYPDDSVSVVFQQRFTESPRRSALQIDTQRASSSVDTVARSQINCVFDQYQQRLESPDDPIGDLTPNMAQHSNWDDDERAVPGAYPDDSPVVDSPADASPADTSPGDASPGDAASLIDTAPQSETDAPCRPLSIEDELRDDEDYRGTVIIFQSGRQSPVSTASKTPTPSHTTWRHTSDSLGPPLGDNHAPAILNRSFSTHDQRSDGLGLTLDTSQLSMDEPTSPAPPAPGHAPPAPPESEPSKTHTPNKLRKGSWGLPSSPAPKNRPSKRDLADDKDGASSNRESRTSKRSAGPLSPAYTPSMDSSTTERTARSPGVSAEEKSLKERWNLMKELVDTEHSYYTDMTIAVDIFMATAPTVTTLSTEDRRLVFGNIEKVRDLSSKFLDALKKCVYSVYQIPTENRFHFKRGNADGSVRDSTVNGPVLGTMPDKEFHALLDRETRVGMTFLEFAVEMDRIFRAYMINHDASNKRFQAIKSESQIKLWLDECQSNAKDITNAWDLDSLLIKPTQRYTKYPLLLTALLRCTPDDHPDRENLENAHKIIKDGVTSINEEKHRREVAEQILQQKHLKESANRLNLKNLMIFRSKGQKTTKNGNGDKSNAAALAAEDDSYEAVRQKFGGHFFQLQIVMRDFEKYVDDARLNLRAMSFYFQALEHNYHADLFNRYPELESKIHQFVEAIASIQRYALPDHVKSIEKFVIDPVRRLWQLHDNPQHLMLKHRKLKPSWTKYQALKEEKKEYKINDKLRTEAENWTAINELLKQELPQLYRLTREVVQACLRNFLDIRCRWDDMWLAKLRPFADTESDPTFFESNIADFMAQISDDFYTEFDAVDAELSSLHLTTRAFLEDPAFNFLVKMTPDMHSDAASYDDASGMRPSTSSQRTGNLAPYSARGSIDAAVRSTPNLNLASPGAPGHSHRLSYGGGTGLTPPQMPGALEGYYTSATPGSGGVTPTHPPSGGQLTPSGVHLPPGMAPGRPWFMQEWTPAPTTPAGGAVGAEGERPPSSRHSRGQASPRGDPAAAMIAAAAAAAAADPARYSGIFQSALPADLAEDDAVLGLDGPPPLDGERGEPRVLFVVASLFEFNIDATRREAGYPYLKYVAGEVFDILGQRGELWLARNQDDTEGTLGWIWEKHFALLPMDGQ